MEEIKQELTAQLENPVAFTIPIGDGISVSQSVVLTWILMAGLTLAAIALTRNLKPVPGRRQLVLEMFVGLINNFCKDIIGPEWKRFAPWLGTVALYITCANLSGLLGLVPPTKNLNVTAALGLSSMVVIYTAAFRVHGLRGGLGQFFRPAPIMLPINLMEVIIRPLSLCMRLFGNVLASFIVMELVKMVVPAVVPVAFSLYFDIFDGIIQTIVFVFLTAIFIGESLEED